MRRYETGYLVREGIRGMFLNPFMSFAAITIIAACLVIMGSFVLVAFNVNKIVVSLEQTNQIVAFLDVELSDEEARSVHTQINQLDNINHNEYVSSDQTLETWRQNDASLLEGLREGDNPFPNRCVITLIDLDLLDQTVNQVKAVDGVTKVRSDQDVKEILSSAHGVINVVSYFLILMLSVVSVFIVSNTIKLATYDRREEIAIMRVVGATRRFIRLPFFIEGALIGFIGGLIAFILQWILYNLMLTNIAYEHLNIPLAPFAEISFSVLFVFILGGLVAGSLGSVLTIRRFLKI